MDSRGRIHQIPIDPATFEKMEAEFGKLVPIPPDQLEKVTAMPEPARRVWYSAQLAAAEKRDRKAARKRQREARKNQRGKR